MPKLNPWFAVVMLSVAAVWSILLSNSQSGKEIIVTRLPEKIFCQPYKSAAEMAHDQKLLKDQGFEPVNLMDVGLATRAQSAGKGELITVLERVCQERVGQFATIPASTHYYRKFK